MGTSGVRACLIDAQGQTLDELQTELPQPLRQNRSCEQAPELWWQALVEVLDRLARRQALQAVRAITLDATSATLLVCDEAGRPQSPALMYNDSRASTEAEQIAQHAPADSAAQGAHSSLAKALWLTRQGYSGRFLHQADWLCGQLIGQYTTSDEHNALKLGYDPVSRSWPDWVWDIGITPARLPRVVAAGTVLGPLQASAAQRWQMPNAQMVAGTTDSTAAFVATGAEQVGQAVTSLGSTLVLKVLADRPLFAARYGIYSHRLANRWLVGGASNSGGAVLRHYFNPAQMQALETAIDPDRPTGLDYYPLLVPGERFPVNDPTWPPRLTPRPSSAAQFFQAMLEGMAQIEAQGYRLLHSLGAPYPREVISSGGGAQNGAWSQIRSRALQRPVRPATQQTAAYGSALLACRAVQRQGTSD